MTQRSLRGRGLAAALLVVLPALPAAARADSGLEAPPLAPMGAATLGTGLQLDFASDLTLGFGRFGQWVAVLEVPFFYDRSGEFFGYAVHGGARLWPRVLGGGAFLEPNVGFTSGVEAGDRRLGFGGGLSFGYTWPWSDHLAISAKAGFDIAPVAPRGFFGVELLVH